MDHAGALLEGHIVAHDGERRAIVERVPEHEVFHRRARKPGDRRAKGAAGDPGDLLGEPSTG